jgi:hypothetical protein
LAQDIESDYSRMLSTVFGLMLAGGMQPEAIRALAARSLDLAEKKSQRHRSKLSGGLSLAALVLDAWHRNRRYLDSKGMPRAIRMHGPAPSVEALVRAERSIKDAPEIAQRLKALRLVVPTGRGLYKPTSDIALISRHDPYVLQHVAKSLSVLLETIHGNLDRSNASEPLIERFAEVPDLPSNWIPAFQQFTKLHGWILLRTVNDWLESRRARRTSRSSNGIARAGIHVHAYVTKSQRPTAEALRERRIRVSS